MPNALATLKPSRDAELLELRRSNPGARFENALRSLMTHRLNREGWLPEEFQSEPLTVGDAVGGMVPAYGIAHGIDTGNPIEIGLGALPLAGLARGLARTPAAQDLMNALNTGTAGAMRGRRPVAITSEAVSPRYLQRKRDGMGTATPEEQRLYGDPLYAAVRKDAGLPPEARTYVGQGAWEGSKGFESNPLYVDVFRPKGNPHIQSNPTIMAAADRLRNGLKQEGVGAHRFNPLPLNRAEDASAALIRLPKDAPNSVIESISRRFGKDMIVAHRPDLGGVFIRPINPEISLTERARMMSEAVPGSTIRYGHAEPPKKGMDTGYFMGESDLSPMSPEVERMYQNLERRNFLEK